MPPLDHTLSQMTPLHVLRIVVWLLSVFETRFPGRCYGNLKPNAATRPFDVTLLYLFQKFMFFLEFKDRHFIPAAAFIRYVAMLVCSYII